MGSNNYAEVITDPIKARQVVAEFEQIAAGGCKFAVLKFNPDVDRFAISLGRESNFPTLQDVELDGANLEGSAAKTLWSRHGDTVKAVDFGNGYFGLFFELGGLGYMAIPKSKRLSGSEPAITADTDAGLGTKFLAAEDRGRIKGCVAHFLIGPDPGAIQAQIAYSILDALSDDHLAELDVMVHDYESGAGVH